MFLLVFFVIAGIAAFTESEELFNKSLWIAGVSVLFLALAVVANVFEVVSTRKAREEASYTIFINNKTYEHCKFKDQTYYTEDGATIYFGKEAHTIKREE